MGSAAAKAGHLAAKGARVGASVATKGALTISTIVQQNPAAVQCFCCCIGIILSTCSVCSLIFGHNSETEQDGTVTVRGWTLRETLQSVYTFFFGLVICVCDIKAEWIDKCCSIQQKLFRYCNFLATQLGRAFFYFYVGSITLLIMPKN